MRELRTNCRRALAPFRSRFRWFDLARGSTGSIAFAAEEALSTSPCLRISLVCCLCNRDRGLLRRAIPSGEGEDELDYIISARTQESVAPWPGGVSTFLVLVRYIFRWDNNLGTFFLPVAVKPCAIFVFVGIFSRQIYFSEIQSNVFLRRFAYFTEKRRAVPLTSVPYPAAYLSTLGSHCPGRAQVWWPFSPLWFGEGARPPIMRIWRGVAHHH